MHAVMLYSNCKAASLLSPITEQENTIYVSLRTHDGDDNHCLCVLDLLDLFKHCVRELVN